MTNKSVTRRALGKLIHARVYRAIKIKEINKALTIICGEMINLLVQNQALSVKNFGTFSTYKFTGRKHRNIYTNKTELLNSSISVKFHPHHNFQKLFKDRKHRFVKKSG